MNDNSVGFHGIHNCKYCKRINGVRGTSMINATYAQSLALKSVLNNSDRYADDRLVLQVPKDDGYEGSFGASARINALEQALGYMSETTNGLVKTNVPFYERGDFYYEFTAEFEGKNPENFKVWLLNVQIGKSEENAATDNNSNNFGAFEYPLRVFGDIALASNGTTPYVDDKGFGRVATMIICRPDDGGYSTFSETVPQPIMAAIPTIATATITGTAKVGEVLTAGATYSGGSPAPSLAYQWKSAATATGSYTAITGATGSTYVPDSSKATKFIKVEITATGAATGTALSSATTAVAAAS